MDYRGKRYNIVEGIRPDSWKWTVQLHDKSVKSGEAATYEAARVRVMWTIDRAREHTKKNRLLSETSAPTRPRFGKRRLSSPSTAFTD
jgi:hypothetical protein